MVDPSPRADSPPTQPYDAAESLTEAIEQFGADARKIAEPASGFADRQKAFGAEQIGGIARAVHNAADELQSELPEAARAIHGAAAEIERASNAMRENSVDELHRSLQDFARTQPAAFFATAIVSGFALTWLMRNPRSAEKPAGES